MPTPLTVHSRLAADDRRVWLAYATVTAMGLAGLTVQAQDKLADTAAPPALELLVLGPGGPGAAGSAASSYAVLGDGVAHLHADHAGELPGLLTPATESQSEAVAASIAQSFAGDVQFARDGIRVIP